MEWLGLISLECQRWRGDLIEVCTIMSGIDRVDSHSLFPSLKVEPTLEGSAVKREGECLMEMGQVFLQRVMGA